MLKTVIYIRVSTDEQAESGTSLDTQREACERHARYKGWEVVAICEDAGVSGTRLKTRPGIQKVLKLIESGKADVVIVTKLDRLARDLGVTIEIANRIDDAGGQLVTADGQEYGRTPVGKMNLNVLGAAAQFEKDTFRERSVTGARKRAKEGIQVARRISPYGYHIVTKKDEAANTYPGYKIGDYVIIEEQAKWVRLMFETYAAGSSLRQVARMLNEGGAPKTVGIRPRKHDVWLQSSVSIILSNPAYKGTAAYGRNKLMYDRENEKSYIIKAPEESVILIDVPSLVSVELWDAVQARRNHNKEMLSGNQERKYLLSGLLRCPKCGGAMTGLGNQDPHRRYYMCRLAQLSRSIKAEPARCDRKHYHIDRTEETILLCLMELAVNPLWITQAAEAWNEKHTTDDGIDDRLDELNSLLRDIDRREQVTAKAQIDALVANRNTGVYDRLLSDLNEERVAIREQVTRLKGIAVKRERVEPLTFAAKFEASLQAVAKVLTADDVLTVAQRHQTIASMVKAITPYKEGFRLETVQLVSP